MPFDINNGSHILFAVVTVAILSVFSDVFYTKTSIKVYDEETTIDTELDHHLDRLRNFNIIKTYSGEKKREKLTRLLIDACKDYDFYIIKIIINELEGYYWFKLTPALLDAKSENKIVEYLAFHGILHNLENNFNINNGYNRRKIFNKNIENELIDLNFPKVLANLINEYTYPSFDEKRVY